MIDFKKLKNAKRIVATYLDVAVDGNFIKEFRNKNGLSVVALSNILGVKTKTVEKWECGKKKIDRCCATLLTLLNPDENLLKKIYSVKVIEGADE